MKIRNYLTVPCPSLVFRACGEGGYFFWGKACSSDFLSFLFRFPVVKLLPLRGRVLSN